MEMDSQHGSHPSLLPRATLALAVVGLGAVAAMRFMSAAAAAEEGNARLVVAIVVTGVVLAAGLYVILSGKYDDAEKKWAFGAVGTILGYWLRT